MNLIGDRNLLKVLGLNESLLFSSKIIKFNKRNKAQERIFAITMKALLNIKGKKVQRRMEIINIIGVTNSKNSDEFIIHCPTEYDYRYSSNIKGQIITLLIKTAKELNVKNFYLWETQESHLKELVTTKNDKKKGISRIPSYLTATNLPIAYLDEAKEKTEEEEKEKERIQKKTKIQEEKTENKKKIKLKIKKSTKEDIYGRSQTIFASKPDTLGVSLNDFNILKVLGRGSFGKVLLVEKKDTKTLYAMKRLRKDELLETRQIEHTRTEKMIMQHINHQFLVNLEWAFTTPGKIFFVMAFMKGGALFYHLQQSKKFSEERARFYAAQIYLGLEHLHLRNIVYRDLKPENILMDEYGNVYLTDFGMAKMLPEGETTESFVGTPEYLAPEIIFRTGHNIMADWWSFGILIYEMIIGKTPFYNRNPQLMYELIQRGDLHFPRQSAISRDAQDIIIKLLEKNPTKRLGIRGTEQVKSHKFFERINWTLLEQKKLPTPFTPNPLIINNFSSDVLAQETINSIIPDDRLRYIALNSQAFDDF